MENEMSLTVEAREYLDAREEAPARFKNAIDNAMDALMGSLRRTGWPLAGDDRAAELEAAVVRYVILSRAS